MSDKVKITVEWGSGVFGDEKPITEHEFDTPAEAAAYLMGITDMDGWLGYKVIAEDLPVQCKCGVLIEQHKGLCSDCLAEDPELQEIANE